MSHRRDEKEIDGGEVERLWLSLRGDLSRLGADLHTAEDIAQDAWLIATRSPPVEGGRVRGWFYVVASRLLRGSWLREGARSRCELSASRERPSSTDDVASDETETLARLRRCVDELPEPYGTVIRMRFYEDREVEEIARLLAVPKWTVHTRIQRGIARLRTRMTGRTEERRGRGFLFVWLQGLRRGLMRPAVRAWSAVGIGLATLGLAFMWDSPSGHRSGVFRRPTVVAAADRPGSPAPVAPPTGRTPIDESGEAPPTPLSVARFAGTVRKPGGEPLAGATVHSIVFDGSRPEATVTSGEDGRYEIDDAGDLLWASHADWLESTRCYLASVLQTQDLDLVLCQARAPVQILVETCDGVPVPGAAILIDHGMASHQLLSARGTLEYSPVSPSVLTDAEGRARMRFPDVGLLDLSVVAPDLPFWNGMIPLATVGDTLEIRLPSPLSLRGVCEDEAGQPLSMARVEVVQHGGVSVHVVETDFEGRFVVDGLAPGAYVLRAAVAPSGPASARREGFVPSDAELRLCLSEAHSIRGRVLEGKEPVEGAEVSLRVIEPVPGDRESSTAITDADGRFFFAGCRGVWNRFNIRLPGSSLPCIGGSVEPGRGEATYPVPPENRQLAPIEVKCMGRGFVPRLIEFNHSNPDFSIVVAADPPGARLFRSPPLPEGNYLVVAWAPEIGTWVKKSVKHDPRALRVRPFPALEAGTLQVRVVLPEGVRREEVELSVPNEPFNRFGAGSIAWGTEWKTTLATRRVLPWSEVDGAFVGTLRQGESWLSLQGGGIAEVRHPVKIHPGTTQITLTPHRGVAVTLVFQPDPRSRASREMPVVEVMDVDLITPTEVVRLQLKGPDHRLVEDGFEFAVWIPVSTMELQVRTRPASERIAIPVVREGRRLIEPGELEETSPRPRLLVPLHDLPGGPIKRPPTRR